MATRISKGRDGWDAETVIDLGANPTLRDLGTQSGDPLVQERARAEAQVVDAIESVLAANGISPHFQAIEHAAPQKPLLLAA